MLLFVNNSLTDKITAHTKQQNPYRSSAPVLQGSPPKYSMYPVLISLLTTAGKVQFLSREAQGIVCHCARVELTGKDEFSLWAICSCSSWWSRWASGYWVIVPVIALQENVTPQLQTPSLSLPSHIHRELSGASTNTVHSWCIHRDQSLIHLQQSACVINAVTLGHPCVMGPSPFLKRCNEKSRKHNYLLCHVYLKITRQPLNGLSWNTIFLSFY